MSFSASLITVFPSVSETREGKDELGATLTAEQKRKVEARARDEVRSVSSYVALLIVADLRRG